MSLIRKCWSKWNAVHAIGTLCIAALGAKASEVRDFSPLKVGNKWEYVLKIEWSSDAGTATTVIQSQTLELKGQEKSGDTTWYKGTLSYGKAARHSTGNGAGKDSTYDAYAVDFRFADSDSGPLFYQADPKQLKGGWGGFWYLIGHTENSQSMIRTKVGADSLFLAYGESDMVAPHASADLQGYGTLYQYWCDCGVFGGTSTDLRMTAFNGKPVPTDSLIEVGKAWMHTVAIAPHSLSFRSKVVPELFRLVRPDGREVGGRQPFRTVFAAPMQNSSEGSLQR